MFLDVGSARLFFDVIGESLDASTSDMALRPTLILLHGGPGYDHSTLRPYFDRYSDTHQLIYLDHRGCGRSTGEKETWHLDQWADDIAIFCSRPSLHGIPMWISCHVAIHMAFPCGRAFSCGS